MGRTTQEATVNRHCGVIDSSRHHTKSQDGERVLDAQLADGLVHHYF